MSNEQTAATRIVIDRFYVAYLGGNLEGMLEELADDAVVTFAGHGTFRGKVEIRRYMDWGGQQLPELQFNVRNKIVDGERAAVNWDETGRTKRGDVWTAIGCDVYRVVDGKIAELTVYGDTEKMARLMDKYPSSWSVTPPPLPSAIDQARSMARFNENPAGQSALTDH